MYITNLTRVVGCSATSSSRSLGQIAPVSTQEMIAKVPARRLDRKSSFAALVRYVSDGASAIEHSPDLWDVESAATDMARVASLSRARDPVYHYVLSWREGENPSDAQAFAAVTSTLSALNLHENQWVAAVHRNTKNVHAHVAANRVNLDTCKAVSIFRDWLTLDRTCRKIEIEQGWSHDNGPHVVERAKGAEPKIVIQTNRSRQTASRESTRARDFEAWNGVESFQVWIGREPARKLKELIERPHPRWADVHDVLTSFNLEYRVKGSGAVIVDRSEPEKFHAKASHLGRFASRTQLEARLGTFEGPHGAPPEHPSRSYCKDGAELNVNAADRATDRSVLYSRFKHATARWQQDTAAIRKSSWDQQRASERARNAALRDKKRDVLNRVRAALPNLQKRHLHSIAMMGIARSRQALLSQIEEERAGLRSRLSGLGRGPESWRAWLARETEAGNVVAAEELRRLRYRRGSEREAENVEPEIGAATGTEPPRKTVFNDLRWFADAAGVHYVGDGHTVFSDEGPRVVFRQLEEEYLKAGLAFAKEKWTRGLCLAGTASFRERATRLADSMGITIVEGALRQELPDLEALSRQHGKPIRCYVPSAGVQLSGRLITAGVDSDSTGRVVIDFGRALVVIRTDPRTAADLAGKIGKRVRAYAGHCRESAPGGHSMSWRIHDRERSEPTRGASLGL